jgi:uncharacterized membrane protein
MKRAFGPMFVFAGTMHFVIPKTYEAIIPDYLPAHRALVYASGVAEIAGGLGSMLPSTRKKARLLNMATLIAVFPANLHMALNPDRYKQVPGGKAALYGRLPIQALFLAWANAAGE